MREKLCAIFVLMFFPVFFASAEWLAKVDDGDGNSAILVGSESWDGGVMLGCSVDYLELTYFFEHGDTQGIQKGTPIFLVFTFDSNTLLKFPAEFEMRNKNRYVLKLKNTELIKIFLQQLRMARGGLSIDINYLGRDYKGSTILSNTGATDAVNDFIHACGIKVPALKNDD